MGLLIYNKKPYMSQRGHKNRRVGKWIIEATMRSKARDDALHTNLVLT